MSADRVATLGERAEAVAGAPGLAILERGLRGAVLFTVAMLPLSEAAKNIGFSVSLALYLVLLLVYDRRRPPVPLVGLGLLGLLGATVLSALASEYPYHSAHGVWDVFRHVSFFFIALRAFRLSADIRRFVAATAVGTGTAGLIFLYQHFVLGIPGFRFLSIGAKNPSAQFIVMILLLLLGVLAVVRTEPGDRWAIVATALILLLVLGVSNARAMWLAFIFLGLALAIWLRRWAVATVVAGLVLIVALVAIQDEGVRGRLEGLSRVREILQFTGRIPLWQQSLRIWRDHPWFGVGPRAFKIDDDVTKDPVRSRYGVEGGMDHAHNAWLHTAAEMGAVGLFALIGWMGTVGVSLWRLRRVLSESWLRALWFGALGAFGAMMVAGVTESAIGHEHSLLLNAELALLARVAATRGVDNAPSQQKPRAEEISW